MKKGTIVLMLVMTVLPAKFVAGLLCRQPPERGIPHTKRRQSFRQSPTSYCRDGRFSPGSAGHTPAFPRDRYWKHRRGRP